MNSLKYNGKVYTDANESLYSATVYVANSLVAESLGVDTITATVYDYQMQTRLLSVDGMLAATDGMLCSSHGIQYGIDHYKYGDQIQFYHNNNLIGKFYVESVTRVGKYAYEIIGVSAIGLLLNDNYYGGVYSGTSFSDLVSEIVNGIFRFSIDAEIEQTPMYGWVPYETRRDALRDCLFAIGAKVEKDENGDVVFAAQKEQDPYNVDVTKFYMGGSVDGLNPVSSVTISEHTFFELESDYEKTLFDGEAAADQIKTPLGKIVFGVLVTFSDPVHSITCENASILESGANYAVISQSPNAVLKGKLYTHTTRTLTRNQQTGAAPKTISSTECALVNALNSENVADRLMAYYGSAKEINVDMVLENQKTGDSISFVDPFGDETTGYISEMDILVSSILKATTKIVSGYVPTASGNYYQHVMVVTESKLITIPAECKGKIRAVLIGGGNGGYLGNPGETGTSSWDNINPATAGGEPGEAGEGGRVFVVTLAAQPGQQFAVSIGTGGIGATQSTAAQEGGATTFGSYSSADGFPSEDGYIDALNGVAYAVPGGQGVAGGHGQSSSGEGTNVVWNGVTYVPGERGESDDHGSYDAYGGYGGGPAVGANGENGKNGRFSGTNYFANGGDGGAGATPVKAPDGTIRGQGGYGGHGGGGGGEGGGTHGQSSSESSPGASGTPGQGGAGGDGADGILLIYY